MSLKCVRCAQTAEPPPAQRVPFPEPTKTQVLEQICGGCWSEWEAAEVRVVNEYRLSFVNPEHRKMIQKACFDFLGLPNA